MNADVSRKSFGGTATDVAAGRDSIKGSGADPIAELASRVEALERAMGGNSNIGQALAAALGAGTINCDPETGGLKFTPGS